MVDVEDELYRRPFSQPLLKCLGPEDTHHSMKKVHKGIYRVHMEAKTLIRQVMRVEFFWSTLRVDAEQFVSSYEKYQGYTKVNRKLATKMIALTSLCPFTKWGMDILRLFPLVSSNRKFVIIVVDYFTR